MKKFENYFVFFIFLLGMILADTDGTWFSNDTQLNENNVDYNITENITEYQQIYLELLNLHNEYRKKHKAKKLVLDEELSQTAMRLAMNNGIDPEGKVDVGTNVFFEQHISKLNARDVFFSWYNTGVKYKHKDDQEMLLETDSFTQIVWKSTRQMGVAVFEGKYYVTLVAIYSPSGNIADKYMANVVTIADRIENDDSLNSQGTKKQRNGYQHLSSK